MKISPGEKKLIAICALAVALPLGIGIYFNRINATPMVSIAPPPQVPKPNGYDLYVAAATAMTRVKPEVDPASDTTLITDPKVRAVRYGLPRRTAWLNANAPAFALYDKAQKTPTMAPIERSFNGVGFPGLAKMRQLARDKSAQSNTLWMRGDYNAAFQVNLDTVQMGHDMRRGGSLLATLVGIAIGAIGRGNSGDTIERLDAAQCKSAAQRLEQMLANRWRLEQVFTEEKAATLTALMELFEQRDWRTNLLDQEVTPLERFRIYTISKQQIVDNIGAHYDAEIANARLPYAKRAAAPTHLGDPIFEIFVPNVDRARINEARGLMGDNTLMLQLALRAYRLEKGAYPANLQALVPGYINAVPADPFGGGEPMRYKLSGQSYALWSIGPDGTDNGGKPIPPRAGSARAKTFPGERPRGPRSFTDFEGKGDVVAGVNTG